MITVIPATVWDIAAERKIGAIAKKAVVEVGVAKNATYPNGKKVEEVAFAMEFGNGNVLPRPFVRNAIAANKEAWKETARTALSESVRSSSSNAKEVALTEIGNKVKEDVVKSLDELLTPPLKPATIENKRKKRRLRPEKPLVDSGKLRESIKAKVVI